MRSPENLVGTPTLISAGAVFDDEVDILNEGFAESCLGGFSAGNSSSEVLVSVSVFGSVGRSRGSLSQLNLLLQVEMVDCFDKHRRGFV